MLVEGQRGARVAVDGFPISEDVFAVGMEQSLSYETPNVAAGDERRVQLDHGRGPEIRLRVVARGQRAP